MYWYALGAFLTSFAVVMWTTPFVYRYAIRMGFFDEPDARKTHRKRIPRLGGLAIILGVLLSFLFFVQDDVRLKGLMLGGLIVGGLGVLDDRYGLRPLYKLMGQLLASFVVIWYGVHVDFLTVPFNGIVATSFLAIPLTVIWIVGVTNAVNLIDGLDGLAAGITAVSSVVIGLIAWSRGEYNVSILSFALCGSALAFLRYNSYPASIFMGDTGSMFYGFMLATLSIIGTAKGFTFVSVLTAFFILAIPIVDTAAAILRRLLNGRPIMSPDREHLHHRLMDSGLGHVGSVYTVYVIAIASGLIAILLSQVPVIYYLLAVGSVLFISIGMLDGGFRYLFSQISQRIISSGAREIAAAAEDEGRQAPPDIYERRSVKHSVKDV